MRKTDRRFARFYYDDFIRDYPTVYANHPALATWMHLLVAAEKAWPAAPELPRSVKPRDIRVLVHAGLVALGPSHTFAIRGHDAERTRRHGIAANAAAQRWQSDGNANGDANGDASAVLRREQDENKTSTPPPAKLGLRATGTNPRALGTNPRSSGTSPRAVREDQKRGPTSLGAIIAAIPSEPVA